MTVSNPSSPVTVTTTATLLARADADGCSVTVYNESATEVRVGGSDVTATSGIPVKQDRSFSIDLAPGEELYGRTASGSATVAVLRSRA